MHEYVCVVT